MNFRFLFFFIFSHFFSNIILSYNLDTNNVKKGRVFLVSSSMSLSLGASYIYVKNSWWNDDVRDFHFSKSNDFVYALNVDKAAHFLGGVASSEIFSRTEIPPEFTMPNALIKIFIILYSIKHAY